MNSLLVRALKGVVGRQESNQVATANTYTANLTPENYSMIEMGFPDKVDLREVPSEEKSIHRSADHRHFERARSRHISDITFTQTRLY